MAKNAIEFENFPSTVHFWSNIISCNQLLKHSHFTFFKKNSGVFLCTFQRPRMMRSENISVELKEMLHKVTLVRVTESHYKL